MKTGYRCLNCKNEVVRINGAGNTFDHSCSCFECCNIEIEVSGVKFWVTEEEYKKRIEDDGK